MFCIERVKKASTLETGGKFNQGVSIRKRDKSVYKRQDFGHWEGNTVVSARRKSKNCFVTLVERKSRLFLAATIKNRSAESTTEAIINLLSKLLSDLIKTITFDRGKEFSGFKKIENELNCKTYFADPYCAWQRGSVENSNGSLREFFPKGHSLRVSQKRLQNAIDLINNRPRKMHRFKSAIEIVNSKLDRCT